MNDCSQANEKGHGGCDEIQNRPEIIACLPPLKLGQVNVIPLMTPTPTVHHHTAGDGRLWGGLLRNAMECLPYGASTQRI